MEPERNQLNEEFQLSEMRGSAGWAIYRERLIARIVATFREFLSASPDRLQEFQGAGRALWDQMEEVDGSEAGRIAVEQAIQRGREADQQEALARLDVAATTSRTRFQQPPRRPGVPIG